MGGGWCGHVQGWFYKPGDSFTLLLYLERGKNTQDSPFDILWASGNGCRERLKRVSAVFLHMSALNLTYFPRLSKELCAFASFTLLIYLERGKTHKTARLISVLAF